MERKRRLPARAAARAEQAAKRRTLTPRLLQRLPGARACASRGEPSSHAAAQVHRPNKPLPTVDSPQPDDLSISDFQTVTERSRLKWTMEGIFEKYYTKPTKKKGVVIEKSRTTRLKKA
ncbi:hypothetical protein NEMBOFW57_004000 [Staphylotrichum longicolle]|uniref:Uncharacterized protein n=1 Tax=Staphylotrichum longicolle TaxID=669026 RepID=A0AAD4F6C2_9PEZI|nr:hypothetical protein NEMBOFW57_004000 [Staphylotrichum longicolle]